MKTLIIAEKPSVGRDIARVLKCKGKGDGFLHSEDYIVSWAIGHLISLNEPEDYSPDLKKWRFEALPIMPDIMGLKPLPKTKKQLDTIKKLMNAKDTSLIICATDSGREGELIFRYIYEWAKCRKPVKRLWISSLTDTAITEGLSAMKDSAEYDKLYASAKCRAEADWLVGMNATRAYTIKFGELYRLGRVQTPTLAMLVARHREIVAFVPKDYWEIKALFQSARGEYTGIWIDADGHDIKERTYKKEQAEAIATEVKDQQGIIASVETEEKRQPPPQLFDLTELQREANRKLGFSAKKTLEIAQSLYEKHKLITYPRTDSRYLSQDIVPKLKPIIQSLTHPDYKDFSDTLLALPTLPITPRIVNNAKVTDHHAIIPTGGKKPLSALTADEMALYDRILSNFLAVFHPVHIYDITTIITKVQEHPFRSKGRVEKSPGWTLLYAHEKKPDLKNEEEPLPHVIKGESAEVKNTEILQKKTQPPKPHTEASLLSAMENAGRLVEDESLKEALKASGLGTPATRAAIIEKLITSDYVRRIKKNLHPTEKGIRLVDIVPPEMRQPETTGKWERGLTRIADGKMDDKRFMESIRRYVVYLVDEARKG